MKNLLRIIGVSIMFLTKAFFLLCLTVSPILASNLNAQVKSIDQVKIDLDRQEYTLKEFFKEAEKKTDFRFFYTDQVLKNEPAVKLFQKSANVEEYLLEIARQTDLNFKQVNNAISVIRANRSGKGRIEIQINPEYITVRGRVVDRNGEGLPGVTVIIQGTTVGTVTDIDGNFSIDAEEGAVLQFSFTGYQSKTAVVGNSTTINITLEEDATSLEEVVVIGFGERRRKDLTGSISTVDSDAIARITTASPQFALQGNATGVRVINSSGNPNDAPQIFVRGIGTWNGDSQPLYVVDGQIFEPPRAGNEDVIGASGLVTPPNIFNSLNPNDIESISVLKDASAAAVYGSRAANGVVLITTKRGKSGRPVIEVDTRTGIQNMPTFNMLNTAQYVDITREMYNNNISPDVTLEKDLYGRNEVNDATRLTSFSPQFDPESPYYISDRTTYDWQDELVKKNALNQSYDVKVSGANDRIDYYVSAGLFDQHGLINSNSLRRYTGAINMNINATDWMKIGINYKYTSQSSENYGGDLMEIAVAPPWQPIYDPSHPTGYATVLDPYLLGNTWQAIKKYGQGTRSNFMALADLDDAFMDINRNLGQFYLEIYPIEGLTLRGSLNLDYTKQDRWGVTAYSITNYFQAAGVDPRTVNPNAPNSLGRGGHRINNISNFQSDFMATYNKVFANKHNLSVSAGVQDQRHRRETIDLSSQNITKIQENPRYTGFDGDLLSNNGFYGWDQRFWFGMVGRASYHYDSKYYLDFSYRRDASNGFDKAYRWGDFYSASGAWRISSEDFFNVDFVDDLKFRGGWGQAGNDQAAVGRYSFLSRVASGLSTYRWGSGMGDAIGSLSLGAVVGDFPNPSLSWEVSTTTNVGFDALLLKSRVNLTVEWYNRVTSGILQTVDLPHSVGTNNPLFNIGEMANRGWDIMAGYNARVRNVDFNLSGNISFVKNEVTKLYNGQPFLISGLHRANTDNVVRIEEGRSIGTLWGYKAGGIFQSQEEIDSYFSQYTDSNVSNVGFVQPGDMYFLDVQGNPNDDEPFYSTTPDGRINDFDRTDIGNTIPGFTYGINGSMRWKGLDFSFSFYGEGDVDKVNSARRRFESMSGATNQMATTLNRWTPENPNTDMPRAVVRDPAGNNRLSDRWVESAAFFRLNNWQLGYSLPSTVLSKLNNTVSSMRVYIGGQNNIYLHKWGGLDPVNDTFPLAQAFNAGLNVKF